MSGGFLPSEPQAAGRPDPRHPSVSGPEGVCWTPPLPSHSPRPQLGAEQAHLPACACRYPCPGPTELSLSQLRAACRGLGPFPRRVLLTAALCGEALGEAWGGGSLHGASSLLQPAQTCAHPPERSDGSRKRGGGTLGRHGGADCSPCAPDQGGLGLEVGAPNPPPGPEIRLSLCLLLPPRLGPRWGWLCVGPSGPGPPGTARRPPPASSGGPWGVGVGMGKADPHPSIPPAAPLPHPNVHFNLTIPEDPGETASPPRPSAEGLARSPSLPSGPEWERPPTRGQVTQGCTGPVGAVAPAQRRPDRHSGQHNVPRPLSPNCL